MGEGEGGGEGEREAEEILKWAKVPFISVPLLESCVELERFPAKRHNEQTGPLSLLKPNPVPKKKKKNSHSPLAQNAEYPMHLSLPNIGSGIREEKCLVRSRLLAPSPLEA